MFHVYVCEHAVYFVVCSPFTDRRFAPSDGVMLGLPGEILFPPHPERWLAHQEAANLAP
jgi:hypothetical protein